MCGIAGYLVSPGGQQPDQDTLRLMCDQLVHRGPDDAGYYFDGPVALGHRRLSIIDVSGGHQPISNEDGSLQVVFNGEIYNYQELRADLLGRGHRFTTNSDTEVLVHLYEEAGSRLPEYLNGMFAFAIWDRRRRELFFARDRFGEKPLYYSTSVPGYALCFASELKGLTVLPEFPRRISQSSLSTFLALSYVPDPATIYEGAAKLEPGCSLLVNAAGRVKQARYWSLPFGEGDSRNFSDVAEAVHELAVDSVKRRMISDVPLGAFLSGGVDSSAVVGAMAGLSSQQIKTFSIGFNDKGFDERPFARMVAERYHTDHFEEVVTPQIENLLDTVAWHFDEPFGDSSAIPMLVLSEITRKKVTVALSGDGADEIFGGYRRYAFGVFEERMRAKFPEWFRRTVIKFGAQCYPKFDYLPQVFRAKTTLTNLSDEIGDAYFTSMSTFRDAGLSAVLAEEFRTQANECDPRVSFRERFRAVSHLSPLQQLQAVDLQTYLPGDILVKTDRTTMAHSLESRPPWLDHRLAELAGNVPSHFHLQGRERKQLFKASMAREVPEAIRSRKKMGFSIALAEWFRGPLDRMFQERVLQPEMGEYIAVSEAQRLWAEHKSGLRNHDRKLWNLLVFANWVKVHAQRPSHSAVAVCP